MFNYCQYDPETQTICLISDQKENRISTNSMEEWLNDLCLYAGSSLKGRRESFISLVNRKKYIPVLISLDPLFVLLPIDAKKDRQAIYLNYSSIANVRIKTILEYGIPVKVSEIHFHDGQQLDIYPSSRAESLLDETALYLRLLKNNLFDLSETL